ncbi:hypothetical protein ACLKA7_007395 [Drosophila subpalustris]
MPKFATSTSTSTTTLATQMQKLSPALEARRRRRVEDVGHEDNVADIAECDCNEFVALPVLKSGRTALWGAAIGAEAGRQAGSVARPFCKVAWS